MSISILRRNSSHSLFVSFILTALVFGFFVARDYGETADDLGLETYTDRTANVYTTLFEKGTFADPTFDNLAYYGPAFLMLTYVGQQVFGLINPFASWLSTWHFFIFLSFLLGISSFYAITIRLFPKPVALAGSLLFATQPLLLGHGFINGKDMPLLSFMLLSIAIGLRLEDSFPTSAWDPNNWGKTLRKNWLTIAANDRKRYSRIARNLTILAALVLITSFFWETWLTGVINWVASASPDSWLGTLFTYIAPNAKHLPLSGYVSKALLYLRLFVFSIVFLLMVFFCVPILRKFKGNIKNAFSYVGSTLLKGSGRFWRSGTLWAAAIALGFATAIRIIGPFGGILVLIFLLWKKGTQVLALIIPYFVIASFTTYFLWPYLWSAPIAHFFESVTIMSDFPWSGRVLFQGDLIRADKLPADYLPVLLGIQLTIPALALAAIGLVIGIKKFASQNLAVIVTMLIWFFLPVLFVTYARPTIYHNFRQFLFILPPLFVLSGFALTWIYQNIKPRLLFWAIVLIALLPGIIAIVQLHPYEYVYYNEFVGGLRGAEGRYELEYWSTSLTHATLELNKIAPANSLVVSWSVAHIVQRAARPDLRVELLNARNFDPDKAYDYGLVSIRAARGRYLFAGFPEVLVIGRQGVAFTVINLLNCGCAILDPQFLE